MRQTIDLRDISIFGWKWKVMGHSNDTVKITVSQKTQLEKAQIYEEFEMNCRARNIKIEIIE